MRGVRERERKLRGEGGGGERERENRADLVVISSCKKGGKKLQRLTLPW